MHECSHNCDHVLTMIDQKVEFFQKHVADAMRKYEGQLENDTKRLVSETTALLNESLESVQNTAKTIDSNLAISQQIFEKTANITSPDGYPNQSELLNTIISQHLSNGELYEFVPPKDSVMTRYTEIDGVFSIYDSVKASTIYSGGHWLAIYFPDTVSRCTIMFYDMVDGAFTPRWDIINTTASTGLKNYLSRSNCGHCLYFIPEGVYYQIQRAVEGVRFFKWTGKPFGAPISSTCSTHNTLGAKTTLPENGHYGAIVHGESAYILSPNNQFSIINGIDSNGNVTNLCSHSRKFFVLPKGYEFFTVRFYTNGVTKMGNLDDVYVGVKHDCIAHASGRGQTVINNAKALASVEWTPKANVPVKDNDESFKANVKYNSIPYGSGYRKAHFVGWHVSLHTFLNAVADENSIFYKEKTDSGAPYYSLVCSSFATLCAGFPYPQINAGFHYDPYVLKDYVESPPVGSIYSNIGHCFLVERVDRIDDTNVVSIYESTSPVAQRTTRFSNISKTQDVSGYLKSNGDHFFDDYFLGVTHLYADPKSKLHYLDYSDMEVINASAKPYKGDKCVYTNLEDVIVNVCGDATTKMIVTTPSNGLIEIGCAKGDSINLNQHMSEDGIYTIHTDDNDLSTSFEYVTTTPVTASFSDDSFTISDNDYWYVVVRMRGSMFVGDSPDDPENGMVCIKCEPSGDYSSWLKNGCINEVRSLYKKSPCGYGAYAIPVTTV